MKKTTFLLAILANGLVFASNVSLKKEYVEKYKNIAIEQMNLYQIPASITLAQGILESGMGQSPLAVKANNHFGIKCSDWQGEKFYQDDDKKGECFRVYKSAEESFKDHSLFLKNRPRYSALFGLDLKDYQAWAYGLKDAGYATDPNYPNRLISIIKELELNELDESGVRSTPKPKSKPNLAQSQEAEKDTNKSSVTNKHDVKISGKRTKYVEVKKGDTFYRLAKEFGMPMWELRLYNYFNPNQDVLMPGDKIYLTPNKKKTREKRVYQMKESRNNSSHNNK